MAAVMRVALSTMAPRQMQYCSRSTSGEYRHWIDSQRRMAVKAGEVEAEARLKTDIEPLDTEVKANLLWIGDRERAEKVVLFSHGGGYMVPIRKGHLEWCWRAYVAPGLEDGGVETAVAVLQYTVTPGARFPTQLRQAASGLSRILASGFRPQDVIIGGDSAGGNLTATLLCHLIQPVMDVPEVKIKEPLGGAFLVSPWVKHAVSDPSFTENDGVDMLNAGVVRRARNELLGNERVRIQGATFPLDGEDLYFEGLSTVVSHMFVTVGDDEVLRDQAVAYVERVRRLGGGLEVRFDLQEKMAHDFILLEGERGWDGPCILAMREWMKGVLVN